MPGQFIGLIERFTHRAKEGQTYGLKDERMNTRKEITQEDRCQAQVPPEAWIFDPRATTHQCSRRRFKIGDYTSEFCKQHHRSTTTRHI